MFTFSFKFFYSAVRSSMPDVYQRYHAYVVAVDAVSVVVNVHLHEVLDFF